MIMERLKACVNAGSPREVDWYFARWILQMTGGKDEMVALAAALASWRVSEGDVCVDLTRFAGSLLFAENGENIGLQAPDIELWIKALEGSPAVGKSDDYGCPLILEGQRLYLTRYWWYEKNLADELLRRAVKWADYNPKRLKEGLDRYFPEDEGGDVNWQRVAASIALIKRFCVISGGPGTGKTTTVTGILALLHQQNPDKPLRVRLAAPTGKAAARITESVRNTCEKLRLDKQTCMVIPTEAMTLHRLIGVSPSRSNPFHGPKNPLDIDALIIDEASMIDLPLMYHTVSALPEDAHLVLLGDKDQLASVEAGSVFADLCAASDGHGYSKDLSEKLRSLCRLQETPQAVASPLYDCVVLLRKSYRFSEKSGIGKLATAIKRGDDPGSILLEKDKKNGNQLGRDGDLAYLSPTRAEFHERLREEAVKHYAPLFEVSDVKEALNRLDTFRVLVALKKGPTGVEGINRMIQNALFEKGLIPVRSGAFHGCPILITRNDYTLNLFNGDVGIMWSDKEHGETLRACFLQSDGRIKKVIPHRIAAYEHAFAMTVHKAQGSEFKRVLLILPFEDARVLTRELLYTGITRSRSSVEVWGPMEIIRKCVSRPSIRASGLARRLWGFQ